MRPIYETQQNIDDELTFMDTMSSRGCKLDRAQKLNSYDFIMETKEGLDIVEFKRRQNERQKYNDYMISAAKTVENLTIAQMLGCRYWLFVQWDDGLFYIEPSNHRPNLGVGGRYDRGDKQDIELMCYYNTNLFLEVK